MRTRFRKTLWPQLRPYLAPLWLIILGGSGAAIAASLGVGAWHITESLHTAALTPNTWHFNPDMDWRIAAACLALAALTATMTALCAIAAAIALATPTMVLVRLCTIIWDTWPTPLRPIAKRLGQTPSLTRSLASKDKRRAIDRRETQIALLMCLSAQILLLAAALTIARQHTIALALTPLAIVSYAAFALSIHRPPKAKHSKTGETKTHTSLALMSRDTQNWARKQRDKTRGTTRKTLRTLTPKAHNIRDNFWRIIVGVVMFALTGALG